jgi:hypothetical protein
MRAKTETLVLHGLVAGLVGYGTVVVFQAIVNLIVGRSIFYTAAALGAALFGDGTSGGAVDVAIGPVVTYNAVHLLFFLALGLFGVFVVAETERFPVLWFLGFLSVVVVAGWALMAVFLFASPVFGGAWWQLVVASLLAAVLMSWYLLARHPYLRRELGDIVKSQLHV